MIGIDYAGPFPVRTSKGRGHKSSKGYIDIFIGMVIWAVRIGGRVWLFVKDLVAAIYSDTTFNGADAELKRMFSAASSFNHKLAEAIVNDGTNWTFIPPRGPDVGELWEAAIKSFKFYFKRVIDAANLTFEEFSTLACRIKFCLNSRPLSPLSSDPADVSALTPGYFLIS